MGQRRWISTPMTRPMNSKLSVIWDSSAIIFLTEIIHVVDHLHKCTHTNSRREAIVLSIARLGNRWLFPSKVAWPPKITYPKSHSMLSKFPKSSIFLQNDSPISSSSFGFKSGLSKVLISRQWKWIETTNSIIAVFAVKFRLGCILFDCSWASASVLVFVSTCVKNLWCDTATERTGFIFHVAHCIWCFLLLNMAIAVVEVGVFLLRLKLLEGCVISLIWKRGFWN